ncbi:NHL domain-containing protein [Flavobacterium sp. 25HG05S-40]|uniref:NHL domain-containing protein n=1 Tax=Flavobacterium sp. 25HG05S-40 TaxID=3458682 RepID=UPI0040441564
MKNLIFALLIPFLLLGQTKVSTLSGTTSPSIYISNNSYNNGAGNQSTYIYVTGVAAASNGFIYAFDDYVNVIRMIAPSGFTSQFCGDATFANASFKNGFADGTATTTLFADLTAIATDASDNVFVMDNNRLRKVTTSGNCTTITFNQSDFKDAEGLAIDSATGTIYVSDTGNKRIRKVSSSGTITTFVTGLTNPKGIALDTSGNLFVCDGTQIKKVTPSGTVSVYASGFGLAYGVCIDSSGNLYVTDNVTHQEKKVSPSGVVTVSVGNGIPKFRDGLVNATAFGASLYGPRGIAIDSTGKRYIADTNNQRIRKVTP